MIHHDPDRPDAQVSRRAAASVLVALRKGRSATVRSRVRPALQSVLASTAGLLGQFIEGPVESHRLADVLDGGADHLLQRGVLVLIEGAAPEHDDQDGPTTALGWAAGWTDGRSLPGRRWIVRLPTQDGSGAAATEHHGAPDGEAPVSILHDIGIDPEALGSRVELEVRRWTWIVHDGDGRLDLEVVLDELTPRRAPGRASAGERFRTELRVSGDRPAAAAAAVQLADALGCSPVSPSDGVRALLAPTPRTARGPRPSRASSGQPGVRLAHLLARAGVTDEVVPVVDARPPAEPVASSSPLEVGEGPGEEVGEAPGEGPGEALGEELGEELCAEADRTADGIHAQHVIDALDDDRMSVAALIHSAVLTPRSLTDRALRRGRSASRQVLDALDLLGPAVDQRWARDLRVGLARVDLALAGVHQSADARRVIEGWAAEEPDAWTELLRAVEDSHRLARAGAARTLAQPWAADLLALLTVAQVPALASSTTPAARPDHLASLLGTRWHALVVAADDEGATAARWQALRDVRALLPSGGVPAKARRRLRRRLRDLQRLTRDLDRATAVQAESLLVTARPGVSATVAFAAGRAHERVGRDLSSGWRRWHHRWERVARVALDVPPDADPTGRPVR